MAVKLSTIETETRLTRANEILRTFSRAGEQFSIRGGRVYVAWSVTWGKKPKQFSRWWNRNDFYPTWHREAPWGGTHSTAMSQLIFWIQGKNVFGMPTWEGWCREHLCPPAAIEMLTAAGYPRDSTCVLCGKTPPSGLDWWDHGRQQGPCCLYERCQEKQIDNPSG